MPANDANQYPATLPPYRGHGPLLQVLTVGSERLISVFQKT